MKELKQKRFFSTREFKILRNSVFVKTKSWTDIYEYDVPFENIGLRILKKTDRGPKIALLFFGMLTILMTYFSIESWFAGEPANKFGLIIALAVIFLGFSIGAFLSLKNTVICIIGGQQIIQFYANSPSEESVQNFIDNIFQIKKEKIKVQVLTMQQQVSEEIFKQQLEWLIENDVIDQKEYEELLQSFQIKKIIGFNSKE